MNKQIDIENDQLMVIDENDNKKAIQPTNNIKEVLSTENSIEEIKDELNQMNKELIKVTSDRKINRFFSILCLIANALAIFKFAASTYELGQIIASSAIITALLVSCSFMLNEQARSYKNAEARINKEKKLYNEILENKQKKLELLKTNSKTVKANEIELDTKTIPRDIEIINLHNKLKFIYFYYENRKKIISYYENGKLKKLLNKGFTNDEIDFINQLVKEDVHNKTINDIEKRKQKKITK